MRKSSLMYYILLSLLRKIKINYYGILDEKDITDIKKLWKTVKPLLSDKSINSDKIHLNENEESINSESKTDEVMNNFFSNVVKTLKFQSMRTLISILKMLKIQSLRQF